MKTSQLILLLSFIAIPAQRAQADMVTLQNGVKMEGILAQDGDGATTLQVSADGYVVSDTTTVVDVRKQTQKENALLKTKWADLDRDTAKKIQADSNFAEKQRAKGLIPYQGSWVTPTEFDRMLELDNLDIDHDRAAHPSIQQVSIEVYAPFTSYYYSYSNLSYRARRYGKPDNSDSGAPRRINGYSSSGNFIRPSEFYRPSAHPNAHYFDPSTGLYR